MRTKIDIEIDGARTEANQKIVEAHAKLQAKEISHGECAIECAKIRHNLCVKITSILQLNRKE